jgi:uncharacterized cupredoxin-like copper-binding protein
MEKKRLWVLAGVIVALFSLALLAAACGDDDEDGNGNGDEPTATQPADGDEPPDDVTDGGGTVDVSVGEFFVTPSPATIGAGTVTFSVSNDGAIPHNFLVIKSDEDPSGLPVDGDTFTVDEDQVDVLGVSSDLDSGATEEVTVDLEQGNYVLICNIPTHYEAGTFVGFTVE